MEDHMQFGEDANGPYKLLPDGRALRIQKRMFNTMLTLSSSREDQDWEEGW
jgi:hypothetical protein